MAVESAAASLPAKMALIGALGVGAQWLAWRLQWPAIVLMSLAGLIVGPLAAATFGAPILDPATDFGELLRPLIAVAVALILFEGGLALDFEEIRGRARMIRRFTTVGAPVAWLLGTLAAHYLAGLPWDIALLFGGLLVVTGPTVIMPLLRQAKLAGRPAAVLKWEGIVNDPVGALLAVTVYEAIVFVADGRSWLDAAFYLLLAASLGAVLGIVSGIALATIFRRGLVPEFLKVPIVLAAVLGCFALADSVAHETGLLAVTAFGMTMANARLASITDMRRFKESIVTLLVSGVFVILTATLTPQTIAGLDWRAAAFVAAMLLIVRPVSVLAASWGTDMSWRERALVGWIAPRGIVAVAVAGFFAAELAAMGRVEAERLVPLTFAMVFATVILHGFTIKPLAKRLGLAQTGPEGVLVVGANPWALALAKALKELDYPVTVADTNWRRLRQARFDGLDTYYGEILSEAAEHKLDHAKYGWLIAATSNDAYNALVCTEFAPEMGRHRVYQLSTTDEDQDAKAIAFTARGRTLIARGRTFDGLASAWWKGARFRSTKLSEEYDLERYLAERPEGTDLVAERGPKGALTLLGPNVKPKGGPGAVIVSFGLKAEEDAAPEGAGKDASGAGKAVA